MEFNSQKDKKDAGGLVLTEDDIEMFKLILEHRFLRREHLQALTGRTPKPLHRRLLKLQQNRYLTIPIRLPRQKFIYGLTSSSIAELVASGAAPTELLDDRLRTHELTELFLRHEMMIVDAHVVLNLASKQSPVQLHRWREGKSLWDAVDVMEQSSVRRLPVRPDALFTLKDSRWTPDPKYASYALEADRSKESHLAFGNKIRAYWNYIALGLHDEKHEFKKFGVKRFRVATVTLTDARAEQLNSLVTKLVPERAWKYFLFASVKAFSLENATPIFDSVWLSPRAPGRHPLVPAPKEQLVAEKKGNV